MATKFAPPPLTYTPPAQPNITVAYIAGPAVVAANDTIGKLPEADKTLDEVALATALDELTTAAASTLSTSVAKRFFEWLEAAAYFSMTCEVDEECNARCSASFAAERLLEGLLGNDIHERAIQAYLDQIVQFDAPPCGPRDYQPENYDPRGLLKVAAEASPLPELIDNMARLAWEVSLPIKLAWSEAVSLQVMKAMHEARMKLPSKQTISLPAAWREAHERYLRLRATSDRLPEGDSYEDVAIDRYCVAADRLIAMRAPTGSELLIKLELIRERSQDCVMPTEYVDALLADARHLAGQIGAAA